MRIRLAVIPPGDLAGVMKVTADLRIAVNSGDMDGVAAATEALMAVTARVRSVDISEEEWRRLMMDIRSSNPTFESDYVVPGQLFARFFPEATAGAMVLQFPFVERGADDV